MPRPSPKSSRIAAAQDAQKRQLERFYLSDARVILARAAAKAANAYKRGGNPAKVFREEVSGNNGNGGKLKALLVASMIRSHVAGFEQARKRVKDHRGRTKKLSTYTDLLDELIAQLGPDDAFLRVGYGRSANEEIDGLADQVRDHLDVALKRIAAADMTASGGAAEITKAFQNAGVTGVNPFAAETVFRSQTAAAWQVGTMRFEAQPAIDEIIWGYEYVTAGDDRVRPDHEKMDGVKAPKDDPIWKKWTPPCGWNCRCDRVPIFFDERPRKTEIPSVKPDEDFPFNPYELNEVLT